MRVGATPSGARRAAVDRDALLAPFWAEITGIQREAEGISTYWLRFEDAALRDAYGFAPGQFNMVYLPGYGEAAISISSDPAEPGRIGHTIRFVGNVTRAVSRLKVGDMVGLRGPFGTAWPMKEAKGNDVIISAGGIGLAPLRPAIHHIVRCRADYGKVTLLYGARTPKDLLYTTEFDAWRKADIQVNVTVDRADESWQGQVGVVPLLFYRFRMEAQRSVVLSCGPEIMLRFVVFESRARRVPSDRIYLSLERNMKCGQGFCGHCQLGAHFICKHGPVFRFDDLEPYFDVEEY